MPIYALDGDEPRLPAAGRYFVAPDAHVIGKVTLEDDVSIWFGAVLRGDNEPILVGARSNVQEHAMLHTDPGFPITIGRDCTIGHGAIVHGATLGDVVLIGMGATVMNGAVIGANSIVGAGSIVTEGKSFPPGSLIIGAPARAIRTLDEAAIARIPLAAESYARRYPQFLEGLRKISG